jgi:hypothetical protein
MVRYWTATDHGYAHEDGYSGTRLSARMRESWATKRFWFDLAACDVSMADSVYWGQLRKVDVDFTLSAEKEAEMERYVEFSREQMANFESAEKEYRAREQTSRTELGQGT